MDRVEGLWDRMDRAEAAMIARTPWLPARPAGPVVIAATTAGRGGALWLLWCAAEAFRRGGDRRFARRAATAVAVALGVSQLLKRLVPTRPRPERPGGPARRELPERPGSSSFPSAHAASAAAFTTAVLRHDRRLVLVVAPVAATAVYGRLRTRVHWPSDLAAGVTIGVAAALCPTGARRVPRRPCRRPRRSCPGR
jgi:undecaprenyl-diphosphatase